MVNKIKKIKLTFKRVECDPKVSEEKIDTAYNRIFKIAKENLMKKKRDRKIAS